jgi:hypothetical protein
MTIREALELLEKAVADALAKYDFQTVLTSQSEISIREWGELNLIRDQLQKLKELVARGVIK